MPKSKRHIKRRLELRHRSKRNPKRVDQAGLLVEFEDSKRDRLTFADFLSKAFHRVFSRGERHEFRRVQAR